MLWFKAWRESRARFWIGAGVIAVGCLVLLLFEDELRRRMIAARPLSYTEYVYSRIYAGVVRVVFVVFAVFLGLGGLHRERAHRTLGFTLALPVRRTRHLWIRAGVGVVELAVLAAIPAVLVPVCSAVVGEHYAWAQSLEHALLWLAIGSTVFAVALVVSVLVPSDYAALAAALVAWKLVPSLVGKLVPWLDGPLRLDALMSGRGMPYFDPRTALLTGDLPWLVIIGAASVAALLVACAASVTARERFSG